MATASLPPLSDRLLDRLSVYQDVVLAGQTVRRGARDCEERWNLIAPHLPSAGSVLDVGSNFGWFGLRICQERPECVVASVEADERSAAVQREVLRSHSHSRICMLTSRANRRLVAKFASAGQRFDAAICLSVLHWLPDHRQFLTELGKIAARVFVELPDPREAGAGVERLRREIGEIGPYLRACFPDRPVRCLGRTANHRQPDLPREMWLVDRSEQGIAETSPGLEVSALTRLSVSWPPRSWWHSQIDRLEGVAAVVPSEGRRPKDAPPYAPTQCVLFTPHGLSGPSSAASLGRLRRHAGGVPEARLLSSTQWLRRRLRQAAAAVVRAASVEA
jgi:SAM-dependent methyltransferase